MHLIHFPLTNCWILANISSEATNLFNFPLPEAQKKAYILIQSVGAAEDLLSDEYYSCLCETGRELREKLCSNISFDIIVSYNNSTGH